MGSLKYESINYGGDEASWSDDVEMSVTDGESGTTHVFVIMHN